MPLSKINLLKLYKRYIKYIFRLYKIKSRLVHYPRYLGKAWPLCQGRPQGPPHCLMRSNELCGVPDLIRKISTKKIGQRPTWKVY